MTSFHSTTRRWAVTKLCTGDSYIKNLSIAGGLEGQSGHPNEAGQEAIANYVGAQLGLLTGSGASGSDDSSADVHAGVKASPQDHRGRHREHQPEAHTHNRRSEAGRHTGERGQRVYDKLRSGGGRGVRSV